ncbi:MAG: endonuclease domain-containing protein [Cyanobacteria bacterium P01_D01_bin.115]
MPKLNNSDFHLPYNPALIPRAKDLRRNMTQAEKKLWYQYLRTFKYRVFRQRPIHHFIVDFYCPKLKLVIEIDGDSHFSANAQAYDQERSQVLAGYGLQVLRFTNEQVLNSFNEVCEAIEAYVSS